MAKTKIYAGIILAVAIVVVLALILKKNKPTPQNNSNTATSTSGVDFSKVHKVTITEVDKTKLPDRFPTGIPLEAGAQIVYNYNAINAKGMFQSSREFISKKTQEINFSLYKDALAKDGWTITQATDDTANQQKIIIATKGGNNLSIRIFTKDNQVHVTINNETKP